MNDAQRANTEPRVIETMADLIEAARSTDDVDGLLDDLRVWLGLALDLNLQATIKDAGLGFKPRFVWKDDGERGVSGLRINVEGSA